MKHVAALAGLLVALLTFVGPAVAVDVHSMTYRDVDKWVAMPARQLRATLADKTIRIEVTGRAVGEMRPVLGLGSLIVYTLPGGKLLWWTPKVKTVQTGTWSTTTLMEGWELPCFRFNFAGGRTECYFGGAANYKEWTEGNPFQLRAGSELDAGRSSLASFARKLRI